MGFSLEAVGAALVDSLPFSSAFATANGRSIFLSKTANEHYGNTTTLSREYPYARQGAGFSRVALTLVDAMILGLAGWTYLESIAKSDPNLGIIAAAFLGTRTAFKGFVHGSARRIMHGQLGGE